MPSQVTKPSNSSWTETELQRFISWVEKGQVGMISVSLTALDTTAVPDVVAGSLFECAGALYEVDSDETPTGWSGIADDTQVYIKFDVSAGDFVFTDTEPSFDEDLGGWYVGNDRYLARVYKDASGEAVQKETYRGQTESADALDLFLNSLPTFSNRDVFSTTGNDTWECPEDVRVVLVALMGAGGGGGGCFVAQEGGGFGEMYAGGAGGASGTTVIAKMAVVPGAEYSVTIGAGGNAGTGDGTLGGTSSGSNGGDSSFDSLVATGGPGGGHSVNRETGSNTFITGSGGENSDPNIQNSHKGTDGGDGYISGDKDEDGTEQPSGSGGDPLLREWPLKLGELGDGGESVTSGINSSTNGNAGSAYGGGGSGGHAGSDTNGSDQGAPGGDGADGVVIVAY